MAEDNTELDFNATLKRLNLPGLSGEGLERGLNEAREGAGNIFEQTKNRLFEIDAGFDQRGVEDFWLRGGVSRMDTDEERDNYLNTVVGVGGWTKDSYGSYALTPEGLTRRNLPVPTNANGVPIPQLLDAPAGQGMELGDVADLAGDAPAVLAETATGMAMTGAGTIPAAIAVMLAGGLAKAIDEGIEYYQGYQRQSGSEVATDVGTQALGAGAGEGIMRYALQPAGRAIMAPERPKYLGARQAMAEKAQALDIRPWSGQITDAPLVRRYEGMLKLIFGDPLAKHNIGAINTAIDNIAGKVNRLIKRDSAGVIQTNVGHEGIEESIKAGRTALADWSKGVTAEIDTKITEIMEGKLALYLRKQTPGMTQEAAEAQARLAAQAGELELAIVPTHELKQAFRELNVDLPRVTAHQPTQLEKYQGGKNLTDTTPVTGRPVFTDPEILKHGADIGGLPAHISTSQMQAISQRLFDAIGDAGIIPGISQRQASLLHKASRQTFKDIQDPEIRSLVMGFHKQYGKEITRFDNALIRRIVRDPREAGKIEPEQIISSIFKKGRARDILKVKRAVSPETWERYQGAAMEEVLTNIVKRDQDPLIAIFTGTNFLNSLDNYGHLTLSAVFGRQHTKALYDLGYAVQLATKKSAGSGGLVAAHLALHPIKMWKKLTGLFFLQQIFKTPTMVKYLTAGFDAPKTRLGAEAITRYFLFTRAAQLKWGETLSEGATDVATRLVTDVETATSTPGTQTSEDPSADFTGTP